MTAVMSLNRRDAELDWGYSSGGFWTRWEVDRALFASFMAHCPHDDVCLGCNVCGEHGIRWRACSGEQLSHLLNSIGPYLVSVRPPTPPLPNISASEEEFSDSEGAREERRQCREMRHGPWRPYAFP